MTRTSSKTSSADLLKRMSLLKVIFVFKRTSPEVLFNIRAVLTCDQGIFLFIYFGGGGGGSGREKKNA